MFVSPSARVRLRMGFASSSFRCFGVSLGSLVSVYAVLVWTGLVFGLVGRLVGVCRSQLMVSDYSCGIFGWVVWFACLIARWFELNACHLISSIFCVK